MPQQKDYPFDYTRLELIGKPKENRIDDSGKSFSQSVLQMFKSRSSQIRLPSEGEVNSIHFIIVHSPEHAVWADGVAAQLAHSIDALFPSLKFSAQPLKIEGTLQQVASTLAQYDREYSECPAWQTFVITLGWHESQMVSAANARKALPYPQLFCVPGIPGTLLHAAGSTGDAGLIGGVYTTPMSPQRYLDSILSFNPTASVVAVAYDPQPASEDLKAYIDGQVEALEAACKENNVRIIHHHWSPKDIHMSTLRTTLYEADSIIILNEPATEVHRKRLIQLCGILKKFICASEMDSVYAGAALGNGIPGSAFGIPLAGLVAEYLAAAYDNKTKLGWYMHQIPQQSGMRFNEWVFGVQGVELDGPKTELLRMKSAFDSDSVEL